MPHIYKIIERWTVDRTFTIEADNKEEADEKIEDGLAPDREDWELTDWEVIEAR